VRAPDLVPARVLPGYDQCLARVARKRSRTRCNISEGQRTRRKASETQRTGARSRATRDRAPRERAPLRLGTAGRRIPGERRPWQNWAMSSEPDDGSRAAQIAAELSICRGRGIERLDVNTHNQVPVSAPHLERLASDY